MNMRVNGSDARVWFSSETPPKAQQGELGYIIDTQQLGIYRNGSWHFWNSQLQLLGEIRDLLEEIRDSLAMAAAPAEAELAE